MKLGGLNNAGIDLERGLRKGVGGSGRDRSIDNFSQTMVDVGRQIAAPQKAASQAVEGFAKGMDGRIHETMMTVEKADISLKYVVNVRNKLMEAYREVMRMGA
jgi:flagellar hook-basal body complex protein FliE